MALTSSLYIAWVCLSVCTCVLGAWEKREEEGKKPEEAREKREEEEKKPKEAREKSEEEEKKPEETRERKSESRMHRGSPAPLPAVPFAGK